VQAADYIRVRVASRLPTVTDAATRPDAYWGAGGNSGVKACLDRRRFEN